jgi:UDP-N-acetylmuramate--alanine ligase
MKLSRLRNVHFVGIGGIGMSGIADVLITLGFTVSGSDLRESAVTQQLAARGARIAAGHSAANVAGAQVLVYSSAVSPENPELAEARRLGIPVIPRAEMLGELMRLKTAVAVAGSHGKTTVTAMVAHLAHAAGLDPTVVIGGRLSTLGASSRLGKGDLMVAEADESDRTFLLLSPSLAVITNIDWEHVDCYPDLADLQEAFLQFANRVPFYGACVACADDANLRSLLPRFRRRVVTYGVREEADLVAVPAEDGGAGERFGLKVRGQDRGLVSLPQVGHHIVLNALAALAVGHELEIPFDVMRESLASFPGADRRFQLKGEAGGVKVVDDYGHHPTEIAATLQAARRVAGKGRVVVLFQPHRYTRLAALMDGFAKVLSAADVVVVSQIYAASERPIPGVTGEKLSGAIRGLGHREAFYCEKVEEMPEFIRPRLREGDLVITLGAGTITAVSDVLVRELGRPG